MMNHSNMNHKTHSFIAVIVLLLFGSCTGDIKNAVSPKPELKTIVDISLVKHNKDYQISGVMIFKNHEDREFILQEVYGDIALNGDDVGSILLRNQQTIAANRELEVKFSQNISEEIMPEPMENSESFIYNFKIKGNYKGQYDEMVSEDFSHTEKILLDKTKWQKFKDKFKKNKKKDKKEADEIHE